MEQPLVSIITNTLNRADLIHHCIESIQKQTYQNYEHIIVDGNSTDNTEEVVNSYNDPHIKYLKLDKSGPQIQMRAGADVATGKYVTFLDDDDEYLPTKLEKQVKLFETEPDSVGVVYCWMSYYDYEKKDVVIRVHKTELKGFVGDITPEKPRVCGTPTIMFRRSVFEEFGGAFDDSIGFLGSDWEFLARVTQKYEVDYVPESLVKVYVNHGHARLSTDFYKEKAKRGIIFHTHFLNIFKDVFDRFPRRAQYHYQSLCVYYSKLNDREHARFFLRKYLKTKPNLWNAIKVIIIVMR